LTSPVSPNADEFLNIRCNGTAYLSGWITDHLNFKEDCFRHPLMSN